MAFDFDLLETLLLALFVLFLGGVLNRKVGFLRHYNIPVPVVGGLVFAVAVSLLFTQADLRLGFDMGLKAPLMLAFFTSVGLGADFRLLAKGGPRLLLFLVVVTLFLFVQNGVGTLVAMGLDLHPLVGLLSGSITLSGGHGTGVAYAERFADVQNLRGAMELAMACATFGLVIGGLLGGPVAQRLITRHGLAPGLALEAADRDMTVTAADTGRITPETFLRTLAVLLLCLVGGAGLYAVFQDTVTLPVFIWSLFLGIVIRNACGLAGITIVDQATLDLLGRVSLALFLAMALMSLRLWELLDLAGPIFVIIAVQTVALAAFAYFVTFRIMGRSYDAAIMSGGHCGFGMGATPTAVANMEALVARYGPSPAAFLVIPMVGAFFIDITNALVIQVFLALPFVGF